MGYFLVLGIEPFGVCFHLNLRRSHINIPPSELISNEKTERNAKRTAINRGNNTLPLPIASPLSEMLLNFMGCRVL